MRGLTRRDDTGRSEDFACSRLLVATLFSLINIRLRIKASTEDVYSHRL